MREAYGDDANMCHENNDINTRRIVAVINGILCYEMLLHCTKGSSLYLPATYGMD
jgi:hypothetical protein